MTDAKTRAGAATRERIDIRKAQEVRDLAKVLRVTSHQIRQAVEMVGPRVKDISRHLGK
ncbi:DUF3606 domain-containing protein [Vineibacter terrae]|uniref:DUF3606 domain-containing protein n=1 Tax=Vineibacter terrae TaxID=2586908 RepID=UPI002E3527CE|nr:DUF3606 domain-containing protein [Vineibacter terrae]HEX2885280.1 DUF3606 domain-containing protein [Vineibacter terrae]